MTKKLETEVGNLKKTVEKHEGMFKGFTQVVKDNTSAINNLSGKVEITAKKDETMIEVLKTLQSGKKQSFSSILIGGALLLLFLSVLLGRVDTDKVIDAGIKIVQPNK